MAVDLKFNPTVDLKCHNATPHTKLTSNLWPLRVAVDFELFCEAGWRWMLMWQPAPQEKITTIDFMDFHGSPAFAGATGGGHRILTFSKKSLAQLTANPETKCFKHQDSYGHPQWPLQKLDFHESPWNLWLWFFPEELAVTWASSVTQPHKTAQSLRPLWVAIGLM